MFDFLKKKELTQIAKLSQELKDARNQLAEKEDSISELEKKLQEKEFEINSLKKDIDSLSEIGRAHV